ncbi:hypothetical protein [Flagellimonas sp.]|uniref:hypothetical protein n=1 Tax=Flagellimonas sp. TaxID=2058762 RepID=UPI003B511DED
MKSVLNYVTVAALLLGTMGFANGPAKNEVERKMINIELDPVFVKKGDKLLVNLLNISQGKVILKIYDSQKRLVYNESINGELVVEKAFNFEKAFKDDYTLVVTDGTGTYKTTMVVK